MSFGKIQKSERGLLTSSYPASPSESIHPAVLKELNIDKKSALAYQIIDYDKEYQENSLFPILMLKERKKLVDS